jgi:hypothetical protein
MPICRIQPSAFDTVFNDVDGVFHFSRPSLEGEDLLQTSVVHHRMIVGDACRALLGDYRTRHPDEVWGSKCNPLPSTRLENPKGAPFSVLFTGKFRRPTFDVGIFSFQ